MQITDIYSQYKIPSNLQVHMLRVTAVGKLICDNLRDKDLNEEEKKDIVTSLLLHDMGNIIKFNLDVFPEFLEPQGKEYWAEVKQEFIDKYGSDEHEASKMIAKEIGANERIIDLINAVGFIKAKENFESNDLSKMICNYCDQRVSPYGIASIEKRITDGLERWIKNKSLNEWDREIAIKNNKFYGSYLLKMEEKIFENCNIKPQDINDKVAFEVMEDLKNTKI